MALWWGFGRDRAAFTLIEAVAALALLAASVELWGTAVAFGLRGWAHERETLNALDAERMMVTFTAGKPLTILAEGRLAMPRPADAEGNAKTDIIEAYVKSPNPPQLRLVTELGGYRPLIEGANAVKFTALPHDKIGFRLSFVDGAALSGVLNALP
ncbi:hypothetical protein [Lacticaseibacillus suihuaensis]